MHWAGEALLHLGKSTRTDTYIHSYDQFRVARAASGLWQEAHTDTEVTMQTPPPPPANAVT